VIGAAPGQKPDEEDLARRNLQNVVEQTEPREWKPIID